MKRMMRLNNALGSFLYLYIQVGAGPKIKLKAGPK